MLCGLIPHLTIAEKIFSKELKRKRARSPKRGKCACGWSTTSLSMSRWSLFAGTWTDNLFLPGYLGTDLLLYASKET